MTIKEKNKLAWHKIKTAKNILLVIHARPDGDAVASASVFMNLLASRGQKYSTFCLDKAPQQLLFLPLAEQIDNDTSTWNFVDFDLIIALDCGSLNRTNLVQEIKSRNKDQFVIEFDHHIKIDDYADLEIRIPEASSTAEVLYYFFKDNFLKIDKKIANCILTGILTDTGNFLYPSTSEKSVAIASKMLLYGAKYPLIVKETWRNKSLGAMKLWGRVIARLKINKKYNFAYTIVTKEDVSLCACNDEELEGIPGFLSNLYGVQGFLMLRETKDGKLKGNLRTSHADIDISLLANRLGGGGHKKASGFTIEATLKKSNDYYQVK